jgi:hypothetical protein
MNYENEVWKQVPGYEGHYEVSDMGRVRSIKFGMIKILKQSKRCKSRYYFVQLSLNGIQKNYSVHRLVFSAFNGSLQDELVIDHIDGDTCNNTSYNLRQVTQLENARAGADRKRLSGKSTSRYTGVTKSVKHDIHYFEVKHIRTRVALFRCEAIAGFVAKMIYDGVISPEPLKGKRIIIGKKMKGCGQA